MIFKKKKLFHVMDWEPIQSVTKCTIFQIFQLPKADKFWDTSEL